MLLVGDGAAPERLIFLQLHTVSPALTVGLPRNQMENTAVQ